MANHEKKREAEKSTPATDSTAATGGMVREEISRQPTPSRVHETPPVAALSPRAILWSVKVRDGELIVGASSTNEVNPFDQGRPGWDVVVCGPSVLIVPPASANVAHAPIRGQGGNGPSPGFAEYATAHGLPLGAERQMRIAHELPRSACVIRWLVPADATAEQLGEMVFGRSFTTPTAAPDGTVMLARRERARIAAEKKAAAAVAPKNGKAKPDYLDDDKDDGFMGSGPAGEG